MVVPALVLVLTAAIVVTITRNWNAWEGGRIEQVTNDAFVRGDVTPLSTKVAGIVRDRASLLESQQAVLTAELQIQDVWQLLRELRPH